MNLLQVDINHAGYSASNADVINNVALTVKSGELLGLIGSNGAGKSTTIKAIMGLLPVTNGQIEFVGENKCYAYIPEHPVLYDGLTLWEHLELAAAAYDMEREVFVTRADDLLRLFRLSGVKHQLPATFSKGMQQKIMLILGFLLEPSVYIVDEPFVGLDPRATRDFLALINQARTKGAGVLMSTHVLDTAEKICDSFVLMNAGTVVAQGNMAEIRSKCQLPTGSLFECFDKLLEND